VTLDMMMPVTMAIPMTITTNVMLGCLAAKSLRSPPAMTPRTWVWAQLYEVSTTMESGMARVTVYRYRAYDINSDSDRVARRMGTREAIRMLEKAQLIEESGIEIDERRLEPYSDGFTPRDFVL